MKTRAILMGGGVVLLILWFLVHKRATQTVYAPPSKVQGLASVHYETPPLVFETLPPDIHDPLFDWFGADQCGCGDVGRIDALVITSVKVAPRRLPAYQFVDSPDLGIPPALKGIPSLTRYPPMPSPISYAAAIPTFWWGWKGLSRVIYTSDSFTLSMATQDKGGTNRAATMQYLWRDVTPNRNALSKITAIEYDGQVYQLDESRSVGL